MKRTNIVLAVIAGLALAAIAAAIVPPPPANQNIGMNDSRFDKLGTSVQMPNQSGCRTCHGGTGTIYGGTQYSNTGVPDRHHNLLSTGEINPVTGQVYGCNNCHPIITGPNGQSAYLERECLDCHSGLNWSRLDANAATAKVNVSRPHHINTAQAVARDCKYCHGSYVANTLDGHYVPTYAPSLVTPEPHYKVFNATSGRYWGGCWACHQNTTANVPELLNQYQTHHGAINGNRTTNQTTDPRYDYQTAGTPGRACNWCHTVNVSTGRPVGYPDELNMEFRNALSATDPVNGTGCENCHDVGTLHNIQVGYVSGGNGPAGRGHINNNWDCNGCHAFWDAGDVSGFEGAMIPNVESTSPAKISTADTATTMTITGTDFLSGASAGTYTAVVSIDGTTTLTPTSVSDTEIVVTVPQLAEGVHTVKVVKQGDPAGDKISRLSSLVVAEPLDAVSATKVKVGTGKNAQTQITITGTGFGPQPDDAFPELGASVTTTTYDKRGRPTGTVTYKLAITNWSDTQIVGTVKTAAIGDPVTVTALGGTDTVNIS